MKFGAYTVDFKGTVYPRNYWYGVDSLATLYRNFLGFMHTAIFPRMQLNLTTAIIVLVFVCVDYDIFVSSYALSYFDIWLPHAASPIMHGIIELHDYVMFIIFLILIFVFTIFFTTLSFFYNQITFRSSAWSMLPFEYGKKASVAQSFSKDLNNIRRIKNYILKVLRSE